MATVAAIPVTIDPDAAAFIEEVGQARELAIMLEHAKRTIPALRALAVVLHDFPETGPPGITSDAHRDPLPTGYDWADQEFGRWQVRKFPPEVCQNFILMSIYHPDGSGSSSRPTPRLGRAIEFLVRLRNDADYHLASTGRFGSSDEATRALGLSRQMIAILDGIESDPVRRAEVVASIAP